MFGRGSRKQPLPPWAVQILTPEYLVDGYSDSEDNIFEYLSVADSDDDFDYTFTSARVQPTGLLTIPPFSCQEWTCAFLTSVVAVLPRDDASLKAVQKAWEDSEYSYRAELFAGPYLIRGAIQSDSQDHPSFATFMLVTGATVESLLPGAQLARLNADALALNGMHVHGFYLL